MVALATHPSMPRCPAPPQCDPTDDILVAPLEPGIADVGLVFLEHALANIKPAVLAAPGTLERSEGARTTIVGYGISPPQKTQNDYPGCPEGVAGAAPWNKTDAPTSAERSCNVLECGKPGADNLACVFWETDSSENDGFTLAS